MPDETKQPEQPDTITRWAVYNTTLERFVGGVTVGDKPTQKAAQDTLEAAGHKGHKFEIRTV